MLYFIYRKEEEYLNINQVILKTKRLEEMKKFYRDILELPIEIVTNGSFKIKFGLTIVEFTNVHEAEEPFYHFAFDIPKNQFQAAKEWVKQKVTLLKEEDQDEVYFASIKANSLYFEDPSGNIVEFIARLDNPSTHVPFTAANIIKMSEISLVVKDKVQAAKQLRELSIVERDGEEVTNDNTLSFMTKGDLPVYLLLVNPKRRWFFSNKVATVFPLDIMLDSKINIGVNDDNNFYIK